MGRSAERLYRKKRFARLNEAWRRGERGKERERESSKEAGERMDGKRGLSRVGKERERERFRYVTRLPLQLVTGARI